ncbi:hypothetical protein, partial [Chitinophaga sp. GbtcB8]|uniref:hypothetical protein n=1 Tax=Chitinophaga sp. GbtcB8 TaxID=2824753 RepID=UPI001C305899
QSFAFPYGQFKVNQLFTDTLFVIVSGDTVHFDPELVVQFSPDYTPLLIEKEKSRPPWNKNRNISISH